MSNEIIKILDDLARRFGVAIDWSGKNVLPYVQDLGQRIITYKMSTSILWIVLMTIALIGVFVGILIYKKSFIKQHGNLYSGFYGDAGFVLVVSLFVFSIVVIPKIYTVLKCNFIPETVIYEMIKTTIERR